MIHIFGHIFKNLLTDFVLRMVVMTGGDPFKFKTHYHFMFSTRWEAKSKDPNDPDFFAHCRRVYLREPDWHLQWSIYNDTL